MKKIIFIIALIMIVCGCGKKTARTVTEEYLNQYKNLSSEVLVDLEKIIEEEDFLVSQKNVYRDILKKQYKDLSYKIISEEYDNDVSYVKTRVKVYDLYQAQYDASLYASNNPDEFLDENGEYDKNKYNDYVLSKMLGTTELVEYEIVFTVQKEDDEYVVLQPTDNDLKKIHGIYNYNLN